MLYVDMQVCNNKIPAMIDTGSELSCIDKSLVDKLGLQGSVSHDTNYTLSGAFGKGAEQPIGEVDIIFHIGRLKYQHTFTVTELSNPNSIILGLDFFDYHSYHLSCDRGQAALTLDGTKIPVVPRVTKGCRVNIVHLQTHNKPFSA